MIPSNNSANENIPKIVHKIFPPNNSTDFPLFEGYLDIEISPDQVAMVNTYVLSSSTLIKVAKQTIGQTNFNSRIKSKLKKTVTVFQKPSLN